MTLTHPGAPALTAALDCFFVRPGEDERARTAGRQVLGRVTYGHSGRPPTLHNGAPLVRTAMADAATERITEVWTTDRPVRSGRDGGLVYAEDGEHFFCAVRIDACGVYRDTVRQAYEAAFTLMWRLGYTEPLRMWNLVGDITGPNAQGMETYRDFCVGRAQAFESWSDRIGGMPAATGIGSLRPGIDLYFLACRTGRARHLENPRQTPAHRYPARYGPKSPSFARATLLEPGSGTRPVLYVSGTASIVGDDTVHPDDFGRQCAVTLANIEALVSPENLARHGLAGGFRLADLDCVKVYVRDARDLPAARAHCAEAFRADADVACFNVGVCRPDLLVEIEGICR
ncbi:reactive intermediate/imine deaminase [Streptomyces sp. ICN441]|uniref:Reactive intermediate/imine deaminase n=1 Tax=Streptomyces tirandamycinicus TaxID=2174846 RepID=A0A2S1T2A1_9ACTN|nr:MULTISPECIES: FkbO/Hyg5 family chorismatase [Streptomyces]AWI32785.1 reactive intermediate/imine deaminase [Streptomyces tirandamycinicus]TFE38831.1 reactive intermediate/imine deaminase [Streptomyces sp. ICN441]